MSTGSRHSGYDTETETIPLTELLADVDGSLALKATLTYGTLYVKRPGSHGDFETLLVGSGGGYCDKRSMSKVRVKRMLEQGVENGGGIETGRDVWPSKWDGGTR